MSLDALMFEDLTSLVFEKANIQEDMTFSSISDSCKNLFFSYSLYVKIEDKTSS